VPSDDPGLRLIDPPLLIELLPLEIQLPGLDFEELALLTGDLLLVCDLPLNSRDLTVLRTKRLYCEDGGEDRADEKPGRGTRGEPCGSEHGPSLG
jgi:hypothetical protein